MHKIYYFFSCFNNYEMLIGEQTEFILKNREKVIILDDHSDPEQSVIGRKFCDEHNIVFVTNKYKGLQMGIRFLTEEVVPHAHWLVCLQQDTFFCHQSSPTSAIENRLSAVTDQSLPIGAIGFQNYVKNAHYHKNGLEKEAFQNLQTWLGVFFLSPIEHFLPRNPFYSIIKVLAFNRLVTKLTRKFRLKLAFHRNFAPKTFKDFSAVARPYGGLTAIELPVWAVIAINVNIWRDKVKPDPNFVFHLWFPDVAMQLLNQNIYVCVDTEVHVVNDVYLKKKYGQDGSVEEGKKKGTRKMEKYGRHLVYFKEKWGFDYEFIYPDVEHLKSRYDGTLVCDYLSYDPKQGPIKRFSL